MGNEHGICAGKGLVCLGEGPRIEHQYLAVLFEADTGMGKFRQLHPASLGIRRRSVHEPRLVILDIATPLARPTSEASSTMSQGAPAGSSPTPATAPAAGKEQRVTKQRLAVSAALDELADFVSTQELHRILQERGTAVSLATSYRILQSLADDGLVDVLRNADGEAVYRRCAVTGHHHHLCAATAGRP